MSHIIGFEFFFCVNRTDFFSLFLPHLQSPILFSFRLVFSPFFGIGQVFLNFFSFFSPGFLSARYFFTKIRSAISFISPLLFPFYRNRFFLFFAVLGGIRSTACFFFLLLFRYFGNRKFFSLFFLF